MYSGSILVGSFLMDTPDSILISDITKKYTFSTEEALELYDETSSIPVFAPSLVNHVSHLLFYLFSNLMTDSKKELLKNNEKLLQQSRISESIQHYKAENIQTDSYPYEKELINQVQKGDVRAAYAILNDLLGYVLFSQGNSLEIVKSRAIELSLSAVPYCHRAGSSDRQHSEIEQSFSAESPVYPNNGYSVLQTAGNRRKTFTESMFHYIPTKNNEIIKRSLLYIYEHFNTQITLEEVAEYVHLHPSYFSSLFKKSTGSSFKEYLNMVRIEESKRLLSNTDFSIIDIAIAVGFEYRSYFSKVFKKFTGLTPKQFR